MNNNPNKIFWNVCLIFLLFIPFVFSENQNFYSPMIIKIFNGTANISTEQNSVLYDCTQNSTTTSTLQITRNITIGNVNELSARLSDFTGNVNTLSGSMSALLATCDSITKQYGDVNRYFGLYTSCNSAKDLCEKERDEKKSEITGLTPFKTNYETCSKNLIVTQTDFNKCSNEVIPNIQGNLTLCQAAKEHLESGNFLWGMGGLVLGLAFLVYEKSKKTKTIQREKIIGLSR